MLPPKFCKTVKMSLGQHHPLDIHVGHHSMRNDESVPAVNARMPGQAAITSRTQQESLTCAALNTAWSHTRTIILQSKACHLDVSAAAAPQVSPLVNHCKTEQAGG